MSHQDTKEIVFNTPSGKYYADKQSDILGQGAYGTVYRMHKFGDDTVVKAVKTFAPHNIDIDEGIPATTLRELNMMKVMDHPNIVKVHEIVYPTDGNMSKMFYSMELCQGSLSDKMKKMVRDYLQDPSLRDINWTERRSLVHLPQKYKQEAKLIMWQLLNGIAYMHSWGITHRDLKPANVMWSFNNEVKIGDFGLAKYVVGMSSLTAKNPSAATHTGEVQTMWYRAPEVILGDPDYGAIVDDWSAGCIMAELFHLKWKDRKWACSPLFAGEGEMHSLLMMLQMVGRPQEGSPEYEHVRGLPSWSDELPSFRPASDSKNGLMHYVPLLDTDGIDLLSKLLTFSPGKRVAARHLLKHKWFEDIRKLLPPSIKTWNGTLKDMGMYNKLKECEVLDKAKPVCALEKEAPGRSRQGQKNRSATSSENSRTRRGTSTQASKRKRSQGSNISTKVDTKRHCPSNTEAKYTGGEAPRNGGQRVDSMDTNSIILRPQVSQAQMSTGPH